MTAGRAAATPPDGVATVGETPTVERDAVSPSTAAALRRIYADNARATLADFEAIDWDTLTDRQLAEMTGRLAQCLRSLLDIEDGGAP